MLILTQEQPDAGRHPLFGHTRSESGTLCIQIGFDTRLNVLFYPHQKQREMPWGIVATFPYGKGPENTPNCLDPDYMERYVTALSAAQAFIDQAVRENWISDGFAKESGIPKAYEVKPYGEYVLEAPEQFFDGDGVSGRGPFIASPGSYPAVAEYCGGRLVQVRVHLTRGRWTRLGLDGDHTTYIPAYAISMASNLVRA